ncbi:hypothetical protein SLEP1_g14615 [Rubroshorea leprosula]|uniref:Uncharacterized protein n=1 Tax=Rubroshorea leprosula TaxID=152421 RepID=A0AAV5IU45_9ROSI|nr:hypothetical protein SLEP1_g14615 [Rubroshorea leprosula]
MEKVLTNKGLRKSPSASVSLLSFTIAKSKGDSSRKRMLLLIRQLYFERSRNQILLGT